MEKSEQESTSYDIWLSRGSNLAQILLAIAAVVSLLFFVFRSVFEWLTNLIPYKSYVSASLILLLLLTSAAFLLLRLLLKEHAKLKKNHAYQLLLKIRKGGISVGKLISDVKSKPAEILKKEKLQNELILNQKEQIKLLSDEIDSLKIEVNKISIQRNEYKARLDNINNSTPLKSTSDILKDIWLK